MDITLRDKIFGLAAAALGVAAADLLLVEEDAVEVDLAQIEKVFGRHRRTVQGNRGERARGVRPWCSSGGKANDD